MTLVVGKRYLIGLPPFPITTVVYLGPVPMLPKYSKVKELLGRKVSWVPTETLRPLLVDVSSGGKR